MLKKIVDGKNLLPVSNQLDDKELETISAGKAAIVSDLSSQKGGMIYWGFDDIDEAKYFDTAMQYIMHTYPDAVPRLEKIIEVTNTNSFSLTQEQHGILKKTMASYSDPVDGGKYVAEKLWDLKL